LYTNYFELKSNTELIFKNKFLEDISNHNFENWIDIEHLYYGYLKHCINPNLSFRYSIVQLNKDLERIKKLLEKYLIKVVNEYAFLHKNEDFIENILNKIYSEFKEIDFKKAYRSSISNLKLFPRFQDNEILFLNFNYTPFDKIYREVPILTISNQNNFKHSSNYIHGELESKSNQMIFGYGDELDDDYKTIEKKNDNEYLENVKSIKYLYTHQYIDLMTFIDSNPYQIFIFGHSCGLSDRTLLNTLFEHENCASIKPFYHLKEDGTDNYSDIVKNISRNFNNKSAMRSVVVNKMYCEPLNPPFKMYLPHLSL